jgi:hypothetical protein
VPDEHTFSGDLWRYTGKDGWHFVTVPAEVTDAIRARWSREQRAFGSIPVRATLGATSWTTSLFYDRRSEAYLLPVKASVRRAEAVGDSDSVEVSVSLG